MKATVSDTVTVEALSWCMLWSRLVSLVSDHLSLKALVILALLCIVPLVFTKSLYDIFEKIYFDNRGLNLQGLLLTTVRRSLRRRFQRAPFIILATHTHIALQVQCCCCSIAQLHIYVCTLLLISPFSRSKYFYYLNHIPDHRVTSQVFEGLVPVMSLVFDMRHTSFSSPSMLVWKLQQHNGQNPITYLFGMWALDVYFISSWKQWIKACDFVNSSMKALNEGVLMLPNYHCFSVSVKDLFITNINIMNHVFFNQIADIILCLYLPFV